HFASQLAAAEAGLGVVLAPEPYAQVRRLHPIRLAPALAGSAAAWPIDDLWLVGHRALRALPRIDAVWTFLLETFRLSRPRTPPRSPDPGAARGAARPRRRSR
ncbi:MAG: hypothetical protein ACTHU0_06965, partial [Kofleriaceae bacterium]